MIATFANGARLKPIFRSVLMVFTCACASSSSTTANRSSRLHTLAWYFNDDSERDPTRHCHELQGHGKRFGIGPVGLGRVGWWAAANVVVTDDLVRLFEGWYPPVLELIESTPSASIIKNSALDRPANKSWGRGRMTLLGDAIHPTTPNLGQGGCLAIEDAFVLARCLNNNGATEEGLRNYERSRYKRTSALLPTRVTTEASANGKTSSPQPCDAPPSPSPPKPSPSA